MTLLTIRKVLIGSGWAIGHTLPLIDVSRTVIALIQLGAVTLGTAGIAGLAGSRYHVGIHVVRTLIDTSAIQQE